MQSHILLLGLGNILLRDEGVGIRALERIQARYHLPDAVQPIDGGVLGLELLTYMEEATALLVIDAVQTGKPPGTLVRLEGAEIPATLALKMSMHQVGFQEVMALSYLRGTAPPRTVVWGIEPAVLEPGTELSPVVAEQLDSLVQSVVSELGTWGLTIPPKGAVPDA